MKSMTIGAAAVVAALAGTAGAQCEVNKWHHFQPGAGDHFGQVVSAWGNLAVVGAPQDDFNAATANAGSQFVYERVNGVWTWVFATTNTTAGEAYGRSVATDGLILFCSICEIWACGTPESAARRRCESPSRVRISRRR